MMFCAITFLLIAIVSRMLELKVETNTTLFGVIHKISIGIVAVCGIVLLQP